MTKQQKPPSSRKAGQRANGHKRKPKKVTSSEPKASSASSSSAKGPGTKAGSSSSTKKSTASSASVAPKTYKEWKIWAKKSKHTGYFSPDNLSSAAEIDEIIDETEWKVSASKPTTVSHQNAYNRLIRLWGEKGKATSEMVPSWKDLETVRILNGGELPQTLASHLTNRGWDPQKCCLSWLTDTDKELNSPASRSSTPAFTTSTSQSSKQHQTKSTTLAGDDSSTSGNVDAKEAAKLNKQINDPKKPVVASKPIHSFNKPLGSTPIDASSKSFNINRPVDLKKLIEDINKPLVSNAAIHDSSKPLNPNTEADSNQQIDRSSKPVDFNKSGSSNELIDESNKPANSNEEAHNRTKQVDNNTSQTIEPTDDQLPTSQKIDIDQPRPRASSVTLDVAEKLNSKEPQSTIDCINVAAGPGRSPIRDCNKKLQSSITSNNRTEATAPSSINDSEKGFQLYRGDSLIVSEGDCTTPTTGNEINSLEQDRQPASSTTFKPMVSAELDEKPTSTINTILPKTIPSLQNRLPSSLKRAHSELLEEGPASEHVEKYRRSIPPSIEGRDVTYSAVNNVQLSSMLDRQPRRTSIFQPKITPDRHGLSPAEWSVINHMRLSSQTVPLTYVSNLNPNHRIVDGRPSVAVTSFTSKEPSQSSLRHRQFKDARDRLKYDHPDDDSSMDNRLSLELNHKSLPRSTIEAPKSDNDHADFLVHGSSTSLDETGTTSIDDGKQHEGAGSRQCDQHEAEYRSGYQDQSLDILEDAEAEIKKESDEYQKMVIDDNSIDDNSIDEGQNHCHFSEEQNDRHVEIPDNHTSELNKASIDMNSNPNTENEGGFHEISEMSEDDASCTRDDASCMGDDDSSLGDDVSQTSSRRQHWTDQASQQLSSVIDEKLRSFQVDLRNIQQTALSARQLMENRIDDQLEDLKLQGEVLNQEAELIKAKQRLVDARKLALLSRKRRLMEATQAPSIIDVESNHNDDD
ncbi:hypothetical protein K4K56_009516 [Colletotrichum sp. SAR 10_98]|nr:hypothetical protein K4K56_009516 [Colletotrichum sp. SAR 10_98]